MSRQIKELVERLRRHREYSYSLYSSPTLSNTERARMICDSLSQVQRGYSTNQLMLAYRKLNEEPERNIYMITFTVDMSNPAIQKLIEGKDTSEAYESIINMGKKYLNSRTQSKEFKKVDPLLWVYSIEYHISGIPHFHAVLESGKKTPRSLFRDWGRKAGNYDFSKTRSNTPIHALTYISKDFKPTILITTDEARSYLTLLASRKPPETPEKRKVI